MKYKHSREKINSFLENLLTHHINLKDNNWVKYSERLFDIRRDLLAQKEDKKECHCGKNGHALNSINCPVHGINRKTNPLIEKCPNCTEQDENIKSMPDGSCGVCGGKGYIDWKKVGKIISTPSPQEESKYIEFEEIKEPSHPQGNPNEKYYMEYIGDCIKYAAKIVVNSLTNKKV